MLETSLVGCVAPRPSRHRPLHVRNRNRAEDGRRIQTGMRSDRSLHLFKLGNGFSKIRLEMEIDV
jgi:hypothetical protein